MLQYDVSGEVTQCWPQLPDREISEGRGLNSFSLRKWQGKQGTPRTVGAQPTQELGDHLEKRMER